jgi:hypothetical protein
MHCSSLPHRPAATEPVAAGFFIPCKILGKTEKRAAENN